MADAVKLAVLIDADNAKSENVEPLMAEIAKYGVASVKRAYGNWTTPNLGGWKQVLVEQSIQPMQQFSYTVGKNSTDSALIIDAMDLLYTGRFGGFCLISSDSDFTRLAQRIREAGLLVYGFGERKTPTSLVSACDKFVYMDVLREAPPAGPASNNEPRPKRGDQRPDGKLLQIFKAAVDTASDDEGWANLGAIGNHVSKRAPDFDPRNYGFKKLSELLRSLGLFDWEERKSADGKAKAMLLRHRAGSASANAAASLPPTAAVAVVPKHPAPMPTPVPPAPATAVSAAPAPARPVHPQPAPQLPPHRQEPRQADQAFMPGLLNTAPVEPPAAATIPPAPVAPRTPPPPAAPLAATPLASAAAEPPAPQPQPWKLPPMPSRQLPKQSPPVVVVAPVAAAPSEPAPPSPPASTVEPVKAEAPPAPVAAKPARAPRKPKAAATPEPAAAKPKAPAKRSKPPSE